MLIKPLLKFELISTNFYRWFQADIYFKGTVRINHLAEASPFISYEAMPNPVCLSAPPPYPYYFCYRYFCRYSCAISGVYNSVVRLMPDISSHFSDNYRQTSGGHLPRVGFEDSDIKSERRLCLISHVW